jgi:hypothetical protein
MWHFKEFKLKLSEYLILPFFIFFTFADAISVVIIAKSQFQHTNLTFICDLILITSYTISLYFLLYLIFNRKQQQKQQQQQSTIKQQLTALLTSTSLRESNLAIYTFMTILGVGDAIFNLTRSIDQFFAILSVDYKGEKLFLWSSFIENFLKLFYQLFLLLFIIYHKDYENLFRSRSWLKWFIGYLSVLCLIQWILIILQEIFQERGFYHLQVTTYHLANTNLTSFHNYEPFLYPLGIEFRICCFIELLYLFLSSFCWVYNKYYLTNFSPNPQILPKVQHEGKNHRAKNSIFFILMVLSILLFSMSILIMLFQYNNLETNSEFVILLHEIVELTVVVFMLVIFFVPRPSGREFMRFTQRLGNVGTQMEHYNKCEIMRKIDFLFLYISFVFLMIYYLLTIVGDVILFLRESKNVSADVNILTFFTSVLTILQAGIQLKQMCKFGTKYNMNKKFMNIAILMNLTVWLLDTFSDKKLAKSLVQINSYGLKTFDQFSPVLMPLAIFFRFHSCIVLVKIKFEKYLVRQDYL